MSKFDVDTYRSPEFQRAPMPGRLLKRCEVCDKEMWIPPARHATIKTCSHACRGVLRMRTSGSSLIGKALLAMHEKGGSMQHKDFTRILNSICETHEQALSLASEMRARGFVENIRRLTPEARQAIERMTGG